MATAFKVGQATTLRSGPWKSVEDTVDPFDANPDILVDLRNGIIPDPQGGSGVYARPGWRLLNPNTPLHAAGAQLRGQAIYPHEMLDGSAINFLVDGGKLFRADATFMTFTDVTPVGVMIDAGITTRVYFASLIGTLFVTDGVNRPWIASDLTATPITGTYIDYDGTGVAWNTVGQPVQYLGAIFVALNTVNGVSRRADISWCNPGTLAIGWQQADFDNNWTLTQNEAGSINTLTASNLALFYLRERSIGSATGSDATTLASTATEDSVAFNVGTQAGQLIQKFGNAIYFGDAIGRPYLFTPGVPPRDIWKQCRNVVRQATTGFPNITSVVATSAFESNYNLYCAAIWSPTPSTQAPPIEMVIFDAATGNYTGRWRIAAAGGPIGIECLGNFTDSSGRNTMIVLGSKDAAPGPGGYVWAFSGFSSAADTLTTTNGVPLTTPAPDSRTLTTSGTPENWLDNGVLPDIFAQTDRLGYADDTNLNVDSARITTLTATPCAVTIGTSNDAGTVEGTPTPSPSADGTYVLVVGCDAMGRGPSVKVAPTTATDQWVLERVSLRVIPSLAGPEDS